MITELNLNPTTELLFNQLEKNIGISKEILIANVLNGEDNLEDLKILNRVIERENNSEFKTYSNEEVKARLGF